MYLVCSHHQNTIYDTAIGPGTLFMHPMTTHPLKHCCYWAWQTTLTDSTIYPKNTPSRKLLIGLTNTPLNDTTVHQTNIPSKTLLSGLANTPWMTLLFTPRTQPLGHWYWALQTHPEWHYCSPQEHTLWDTETGLGKHTLNDTTVHPKNIPSKTLILGLANTLWMTLLFTPRTHPLRHWYLAWQTHPEWHYCSSQEHTLWDTDTGPGKHTLNDTTIHPKNTPSKTPILGLANTHWMTLLFIPRTHPLRHWY